MKLSIITRIFRDAKHKAGDIDPDVEFWVGEQRYDVAHIGQFGIIPDVTVHLKANPAPLCEEIDPARMRPSARKSFAKAMGANLKRAKKLTKNLNKAVRKGKKK